MTMNPGHLLFKLFRCQFFGPASDKSERSLCLQYLSAEVEEGAGEGLCWC